MLAFRFKVSSLFGNTRIHINLREFCWWRNVINTFNYTSILQFCIEILFCLHLFLLKALSFVLCELRFGHRSGANISSTVETKWHQNLKSFRSVKRNKFWIDCDQFLGSNLEILCEDLMFDGKHGSFFFKLDWLRNTDDEKVLGFTVW